MSQLLGKINSPADLKKLPIEQLPALAEEVRQFVISSVSRTGGHLASNLGVVELTTALHYVFDFKKDKLLWDVGHQCYIHKILTGRKDRFGLLRQRGGISGFPAPAESEYDQFIVGHAGTSIATALGMAMGAQRRGTDEKIVAVVGDACIVNGLSFEAMNNLGLVKRQLLIVLNDNSMAIDVTQGTLAKVFARVRLSQTYEDMRRTTNSILEHFPVIGRSMEEAIARIKKTIRMAISSSQLFESLNIPYFGPVDGHDIGALVELFGALAELDHPALLHVYTKKGKGFEPADNDPCRFHSTGPFETDGDVVEINFSGRSFTNAFGDALAGLAERDERIVAITAAMPDGTGLTKFREKFPARYYDVGIAESLAVDIAAGLAKSGARPIVCIYSTFLQRCFDEIFEEVALQNLPVVFCIDRAGFVGGDGATHHGLMDIGFLRMIPNMVLIAPSDESELKAALEFAVQSDRPIAMRYPKDIVWEGDSEGPCATVPFELGRAVFVKQHNNSKVAIAAYGSVLKEALAAESELNRQGITVDVINARFAKPIDGRIISLLEEGKRIISVEDHSEACGFGSALLEMASKTAGEKGAINGPGSITVLGACDGFVEADARARQLAEAEISALGIVKVVKRVLNSEKAVSSQPGVNSKVRIIEYGRENQKDARINNLR